MSGDYPKTDCCIVGGGPAGMMLGYLLARTGVHVTVLEKHGDFFRDFRGDTVHPSTLEVLRELGLLEDFLKLPHQELQGVSGMFGDFAFQAADFRHLPTHCKFVALMPQWDFLNFLSERARQYPSFDLRMQHEVIGLIESGERVSGAIARTADGAVTHINAGIVIGCDGRHSVTRTSGGLELIESGAPIDVLWFHISRKPDDPEQVFGIVNYGKALILINRNDYFQAGLIVRKGSFDAIRQRGLDAFRRSLAQIAPHLRDRVDELKDWDQIKLLTVRIDRLRRWHRPGLLCIGDAAHAMSPAGGVGINLAIQDAVAAANILGLHLVHHNAPDAALAAVQERREFPTRVTQAVQVKAHQALARTFENEGPVQAPMGFKVVTQIPGVHHLVGYAIGVGARPEHVGTLSRPKAPGRAGLTAAAIATALGVAGAILGFALWRRRRNAIA